MDLRDASGPSSTVHWSLIRTGLHGSVAVKKPSLRELGRKGSDIPKYRITGLGKTVATGLMEWWILPRVHTSALLRQILSKVVQNKVGQTNSILVFYPFFVFPQNTWPDGKIKPQSWICKVMLLHIQHKCAWLQSLSNDWMGGVNFKLPFGKFSHFTGIQLGN